MKPALFLILVVGASARRNSWGNLLETVTTGLLGNQPSLQEDGKVFRGSGTRAEFLAETPEFSNDYNEQIEVTSSITLEAIVATVWCFMISCIPVILIKYSDEDVTTIHYVEAILLLVWLGGGIAAFTQIILFQSAHFEGIRSLTMVESTYLLTQILTTIGYGDITPAFPRGQVVVAFYILLSVILVGNMFSQVVGVIQHRLSKLDRRAEFSIEEDEAEVRARLNRRDSENLRDALKTERPTTFEWVDPPALDNMRVVKALVVFGVIATIGILFFTLYPGEGKSLLEAIYMSIVTLSTVGFGAFTATTEVGKAFSSFWMLVGVAALGHLVNCCVEWSLQKRTTEGYSPDKESKAWKSLIKAMDRDADGHIDAEEFMKFALVHAGYATEEQVEKVAHFFRRMRPDKDGKVPIEMFENLGAPAMIRTPRSETGSPRKEERA